MAPNPSLKIITWKNSLYFILFSAGGSFLIAGQNWIWGGMDLIMTPLASASILVVCIILLAYGLRVRRWTSDRYSSARKSNGAVASSAEKTPPPRQPYPALDPIQATRTVILSQASIITASLLIGWHIGVVVYRLNDWINHLPHEKFFCITIAFLVLIALLITGFLVQKWCRIPPAATHKDSSFNMAKPTF